MSEPTPQEKAAQQAGYRAIVGGLHMLVRSVRLYDPDNAVFQKPLQALLEATNAVYAREGALELAAAGGALYVNGQLVRVESGTLEGVRMLVAELEAKKVGAIQLIAPTTIDDLKSLVAIFAKDQKEVPSASGLSSRPLVTIRVSPWTGLQEKLTGEGSGATAAAPAEASSKTLALYARALLQCQAALEAYRGGALPAWDGPLRIAQELVEQAFEKPEELLQQLCAGEGDRALAHHLVNTGALAVLLGMRLGAPRAALRDLGFAALMLELPQVLVPLDVALSVQPESLPPEVLKQAVAARRGFLRQLSVAGSSSRALRLLAAVASEAPAAFSRVVRDEKRPATITPQGDPLWSSRLCSVARYLSLLTSPAPGRPALAPREALVVMGRSHMHRFDLEMLGQVSRALTG